MNRRDGLLILFTIILAVTISGVTTGQSVTDPEAEYARIRTMAHEGDLTIAEHDARLLVKQFPAYGDARLLLGRILAWQKKYEEAGAVIDTLLTAEPGNEDAARARKDIRRWSASDKTDRDSVDTDVRVAYMFDTFTEPYERLWQVARIGAGHYFEWGTMTGGVNTGHLITGAPDNISKTEWQVDAEAWPELSKDIYAYLAYAYSPGNYFPRHRAAIEVWQSLPMGWAASAGLNYYHFSSDVFIATVSLEKYLGSWWFSARGYFYFKDIGVTTSLYLNARRYFNTTDYLQLTLGLGTAPDEPFDIISDLERLSSNSLRITYFYRISSRLSLRVGAGYSYEEHAEGEYRNRFEGSVGLNYAIRMKR